jgi:hypothetical protein
MQVDARNAEEMSDVRREPARQTPELLAAPIAMKPAAACVAIANAAATASNDLSQWRIATGIFKFFKFCGVAADLYDLAKSMIEWLSELLDHIDRWIA